MALEHGLPGERGPALERAPAHERGPSREPMVIRARVRAWLLGIRLLTLEAHITAGSDGGLVVTLPRSPQSHVLLELPAGPGSPAVTRSAPPAAPGTSVALARQLVEQGTRTLEQGRRRPRS